MGEREIGGFRFAGNGIWGKSFYCCRNVTGSLSILEKHVENNSTSPISTS